MQVLGNGVRTAGVRMQIPLGPIHTAPEVLRNTRAELKPSEKLKYINPHRYEVEMQV